jgi:tetratricopeptide (TPR) repeat protein
MRSAAREWPLFLGAAAVSSLGLLFLSSGGHAPPAPPVRPAAAPRPEDPADLVLRGIRLLETGTGDPLPPILGGLSRVKAPEELDRAGLDLPRLAAALRAAWERESDPERLAAFSRVVQEIVRLRPDLPVYELDLADLWRRAGRDWDAADRYLSAALGGRLDPRQAARAGREAAESYARGGFLLQAASLFGRFQGGDPGDVEALYRRAECLMRAGLWEPDAMAAFSEYVDRVKPGDPLLPRALLSRALMMSDLGRLPEAVREFERLLRDPALGIDPRTEEWGEALLGRGRALLEVADAAAESARPPLRREARQAFEEYLERYAPSGPLGPRALEAGTFLVRLRAEEGEGKEALERLDGLLARLPSPDPEEGKDFVLELRFLRGDLLSRLGRHEEAARAYGAAARRHSAEPERLWGYVGRARALMRLGRRDEALLEGERARAVYESERAAFDRSLAGRGRRFWNDELEALAREVR